ncbi:hypothetical protein L1049_019862 [Liquidambar formosana]|uniref:Uncharacterized protein n=1 Tax=Liquidambar formosana TaxID=63359 RepID=A0AAP0X5K5_LIQFO
MNDFGGLLASDFGFKPQGKSAPMAASKSSANLTPNSTLNFGIQSHGASRSSRGSNSLGGSFVDDHDAMFGSTSNRKTQDFGGIDAFGDVFGGPPKYTSTTESRGGDLAFNFDSVSRDSGVKSSSLPVYDEPVYDEDIFDGVPGLKSSASVKYDDVFSSISSPPKRNDGAFDELLGSFGGARPESKSSGGAEKDVADFDDLIPGFGGSSPSGDRPPSEASWPPKSTISATKTTSNVMEDPFVVLESTSPPVVPSSEPFIDPLEEISRLSKSGSSRVDDSSVSGGVSDDIDPLDGLGRSAPAFSSKKNDQGKDRSPLKTGPSTIETKTSARKESVDKSSVRSPESHSQKMSVDNYWESHQSLFDMPAVSNGFSNSVGQTGSPPSYVNASPNETNSQVNMSSTFEETLDSSEDVWLTVSEFPLFTQLTSAPPPSRPPPPRPAKVSKARIRTNVDERAYVFSGEEMQTNSDAAASAAAMKEAMDRAEAKFRHAKEVRERETAKAARSKEAVQLEKDEKAIQDAQERAFREREERLERERQQREREEEEGEQRELEQERERVREIEREKEEKEREQRRLEKERERVREIEREREKARQAVDRATKEARERAAAESRLKAERAAVQRAQAEARERAAADAKQRAERLLQKLGKGQMQMQKQGRRKHGRELLLQGLKLKHVLEQSEQLYRELLQRLEIGPLQMLERGRLLLRR